MSPSDQQLVEALQDVPSAPVQVEIPADGDEPKVNIEGDEPPGEPQPVAPEQKQKPKKRADNRVHNALRERDHAVNAAAELQRQLDQAKAEADELKRRSTQAEAGTFNAIEAQKRSELDKAKQDYAQARTANDPVAEADALERISGAKAALNDVEAWKATRGPEADPEVRPQPQQQAPRQQPQNLPPPPPDPTTNAYLQENRWFLPYEFDQNGAPVVGQDGKLVTNQDYDGDMHDEAVLLHKKLDREFRAGRFPHAPGSVGYYEEIAGHMRNEFPDYFGDDEEPQPHQHAQRTPPMQQSRQPVAPASRNGMPGQNSGTKKGGDKPTLTREQAEFALSLRNAKAPGYVKRDGKPMSDQEALYKHWQEVEKDKPNTVTR